MRTTGITTYTTRFDKLNAIIEKVDIDDYIKLLQILVMQFIR